MLRGFFGPYLEGDNGNPSGGGTPSDPPAPTPASGGNTGGDAKTLTLTQEALDALITDRLNRQKNQFKDYDTFKQKAAEFDKLKDAEKPEVERLTGRIKELEPLQSKAEAADRYVTMLNAQVDAEIKDWPKEVKALDPGADNLDARMDWLNKSRALAKALQQAPKAPETDAGKGNGGSPPAPSTVPQQAYRFQNPGDVQW